LAELPDPCQNYQENCGIFPRLSRQGDRRHYDRPQLNLDLTLIPLVYGELHRLAAHYLRRERRGHTLQTRVFVESQSVS
jgi:hypothetical protein